MTLASNAPVNSCELRSLGRVDAGVPEAGFVDLHATFDLLCSVKRLLTVGASIGYADQPLVKPAHCRERR